MNLRALNIHNVAETDAMLVVEEVQSILDNDEFEIPSEVVSVENILYTQRLQAYYANQGGYLMGLWGALRVQAKKDSDLIALRDFLEAAVSTCKRKYEAASRQLTAYEMILDAGHQRERTL